ncbi:MAG: S49 family peptidase [Candidatus Eisenbacteria bacterium]|nr:S49 family peptidase [Candidatus Eisenbacteria bacterium]
MKRFFITFAAVVAGQIFLICAGLLGMFFFVMLLAGAGGGRPDIPRHAYLVQEIPTQLLEYDPPRRFPIGRPPVTHTMLMENLERAARDPRIEAIVLKLDISDMGWGKIEELRQRIHEVRASGKRVYAYAPFALNQTLYLASACDSIIVPPEGIIWFTGLMAERMYIKDMLDKIGVGVQVARIREYKAAPEMYERTDMSPAARENATRLLGDIYQDYCAAIAVDRDVDLAEVDAWMETGQFDPASAKEAGLIDDALVWEELVERISRGSGRSLEEVDGVDYARTIDLHARRHPKVAVVHGQGTITTGRSGWTVPFGTSMGEETMVEALDQAGGDDGIAAIVLRLDTPGGLGLASERIGRAVERAAKRKPLVVSTADMNASGGYMVSYRASAIVAPGNAIVGSIGIFAVRPDFGGLSEKLGIDWDRVTVGPHATLSSATLPMSDAEFGRFAMVQRSTYDRWIAGIARHRGMRIAQVDSLARGQVYTGRQALEAGLIDALGGMDVALGIVREDLGLSEEAPLTLVHYPVPRSIWEELRSYDAPTVGARIAEAFHLGHPLAASVQTSLETWEAILRGEDELLLCPWRF